MVQALGYVLCMNDKKYKVIHLKRTSRTTCLRAYEHRIVAEKMIGRKLRKNEIVHHKNGNTKDNRPSNLEIMDNADHIRHHLTGPKAPWYLKDITVKKIKSLMKDGLSLRAIGRYFGVPHVTISRRLKKGDAQWHSHN